MRGRITALWTADIDFVRIAEGYGVQARAVSTTKDFVVAFEDALAGTQPVVIEVLTAPLVARATTDCAP